MTFLRFAAVLTALGAAFVSFYPPLWPTARAQSSVSASAAPDFTGADRWYNSAPLTIHGLRGKVVLVEFWTRECINCIDVLPHVRALHDAYAKDGLVVISVHTPEYDEERDPQALQAAIHRLGMTWPVAVDNESRIWSAYGNNYWPALYLIDQNGRVVYRHDGEGHYAQTEQRIRALLHKP